MSKPPPSKLAEVTRRLDELVRLMDLVPLSGGAARGQLFGADVRLEIIKQRELCLRVRLPVPLPTGLQLDSEQAVAAARRAMEFRDIQVGTPAFDECVHVRALDPEAALRILRDEELLRLVPLWLKAHPLARLAGDELIVPLPSGLIGQEVRGVVKETAELAVAFGRAGAEEEQRAQRALRERPAAPVSSPRPGAGVERGESGLGYLNRVRSSFRRRRWGLIALRVVPFPCMLLVLILFYEHALIDIIVLFSILASVSLSAAVWRCPACGGSLDAGGELSFFGGSLRSCSNCGITLNPHA